MPVRRPVEVTAAPKPTSKEVTVEQLFNWGRARKGAPLLHKMLFLVYLPIGIVLLVARALTFFMVCLGMIFLPRSIGDIILPPLLRITNGLVVKHNHHTRRLTDVPYVLAGNHVSDFDTFALWSITPRWSCVTSAHLKSIPVMGAVYRALDAIFVAPTPESREQTKEQIKARLAENKNPVLIFPEGGLTNGKVGTMMYHKFVFSLDVAVVPVAIRLRNFWPVEHDYLGSSWGKNFFWYLAVPFNYFEITFLPVETRREGETPEEFALRVQHITSDYLNITATKHSYADKKKLVADLKEKKKAARAAAAAAKSKSE